MSGYAAGPDKEKTEKLCTFPDKPKSSGNGRPDMNPSRIYRIYHFPDTPDILRVPSLAIEERWETQKNRMGNLGSLGKLGPNEFGQFLEEEAAR